MSVRLTDTERRVAELYGRGLRPREIAEELGISINTVYKALSKARKAMGEEAVQVRSDMAQAGTYSYTISVVVTSASLGQPASQPATQAGSGLEEYLKRLEGLLERLEAALRQATTAHALTPSEPKPSGNGHVPEHLRKNVWVSLIRSRA